jgi:hypothetical protein
MSAQSCHKLDFNFLCFLLWFGILQNLLPNLGWYAFRHTYRTLLDDLGTPIGVQQKLMRHSDVRTTMNHYGSAYEKTKRRANTLVAGKLLPESMKAASRTTIH